MKLSVQSYIPTGDETQLHQLLLVCPLDIINDIMSTHIFLCFYFDFFIHMRCSLYNCQVSKEKKINHQHCFFFLMESLKCVQDL